MCSKTAFQTSRWTSRAETGRPLSLAFFHPLAEDANLGSTDSTTVAGQYHHPANLDARIALHERFSTNRVGLSRWLFTQMTVPPRARILELGCGVGIFWIKNLDRLSPDWRVILTDASLGMVREAARRLAASRHPFAFATVDAQALPFAPKSFDAVLAHFMLYHVPDRRRALAEVARVLRPDGVFYAATNGPQHMREAKDFAAKAGLLEPDAFDAGDAAGFSLEDGAMQMAPWFADITLRRYEDTLVVTDAEPLLAYLLSGWDVQAVLAGLGPDEADRRVGTLRMLVEEEIASSGRIRITKDSGVFTARRVGGVS